MLRHRHLSFDEHSFRELESRIDQTSLGE